MKTFNFYGVCDTCYKLDDIVWDAIEDPDDGYRSYLKSIEVKQNTIGLTFFRDPIAIVKVELDGEYDGWKLVDVADNWVWLRIGTDHSEDYYPNFIFEYSPKPTMPTWLDFIQEN